MPTLLRLLKLIGPFRWWIALGVLLSFATTGASVGLIAVSAYLISKAAIVTAFADVAVIVTAVRFFALSRAGLRYAERYVNHKATFRILTRLRVWFFRAVEPLAPARLLHYRSGDLLARTMADIETLENFYLRVVTPTLAAVLVAALACMILGSFDISLGLTLLLFTVLAGVVLPLAVRRLSRHTAAAMVATRADMNAALVDEIQGIADMLAYGQESIHRAKARTLSRQLHGVQEQLAMVRGLGNGVAALLTGLAGLAVLGLAIPLVSSGAIDGVFLALLPLTAIVSFEAVQPLAQAFHSLGASRAAAGRVFDLIDARPPVKDPSRSSPPPTCFGIDVANLRFRYEPDDPQVLDGINFSVPPGGRIVLVQVSPLSSICCCASGITRTGRSPSAATSCTSTRPAASGSGLVSYPNIRTCSTPRFAKTCIWRSQMLTRKNCRTLAGRHSCTILSRAYLTAMTL